MSSQKPNIPFEYNAPNPSTVDDPSKLWLETTDRSGDSFFDRSSGDEKFETPCKASSSKDLNNTSGSTLSELSNFRTPSAKMVFSTPQIQVDTIDTTSDPPSKRKKWDITGLFDKTLVQTGTLSIKKSRPTVLFDGIEIATPRPKKHSMVTRLDSIKKTPLLNLRSRSIVKRAQASPEELGIKRSQSEATSGNSSKSETVESSFQQGETNPAECSDGGSDLSNISSHTFVFERGNARELSFTNLSDIEAEAIANEVEWVADEAEWNNNELERNNNEAAQNDVAERNYVAGRNCNEAEQNGSEAAIYVNEAERSNSEAEQDENEREANDRRVSEFANDTTDLARNYTMVENIVQSSLRTNTLRSNSRKDGFASANRKLPGLSETKKMTLAEQVYHFHRDTPPRFRTLSGKSQPPKYANCPPKKVQITVPITPISCTSKRLLSKSSKAGKPSQSSSIPIVSKVLEFSGKKEIAEEQQDRRSTFTLGPNNAELPTENPNKVFRFTAVPTKVKPFSFDARDKLFLERKRQRIDKLKEAVKVPVFRASKLPSYLKQSGGLVKSHSCSKLASEENKVTFKAKEATVLTKKPFTTRKRSHPLSQITGSVLNADAN